MEEADKDWIIRMVGGQVILLVPAHPGSPRQRAGCKTVVVIVVILWIVMAALRSRCGHYIFVLWFLLSIFFFYLCVSFGVDPAGQRVWSLV